MKYFVNLCVVMACVLFSTNPFYGQDYSSGKNSGFYTGASNKILVVPFEDKMFLSDLNKQFGKTHNLSYAELRTLLREGLNQLVAAQPNVMGYDLLERDYEGDRLAIADFHGAIHYDYEIPSQKPSRKQFLKPHKKEQTGRGVSVQNGQVIEDYDGKERFMNAKVDDLEAFKILQNNYEFDYLISINQLDIKNNKPVALREKYAYDRTIAVHYTILDREGNEVSSGLAKSNFEFESRDLFEVSRENFDLIGQFICNKIAPTQSSIVATQSAEVRTDGKLKKLLTKKDSEKRVTKTKTEVKRETKQQSSISGEDF